MQHKVEECELEPISFSLGRAVEVKVAFIQTTMSTDLIHIIPIQHYYYYHRKFRMSKPHDENWNCLGAIIKPLTRYCLVKGE